MLVAQILKKSAHFAVKYVRALCSCLYLFTVGVFSSGARSVINTICDRFDELRKISSAGTPPKALIPMVEAANIAPENVFFQVRQPARSDGSISLIETIVVARAIRQHRPANLFEFGTFDGRTTLNMAANSPDNAKVYTLDLPVDQVNVTKKPIESLDRKYIEKPVAGSKYFGQDVAHKIVQLCRDSATFDYVPYYNTMDFVFIDGAHSYEYVLNDSMHALKLLRDRKGVIFWHDYDWPWWQGVTRALNELYATNGACEGLKYIQGTTLVSLVRR